ncbi:DTW domain protein [Marinomonas aquimarina]|uniref:tRNA-uridine aminocarboxypropyltransferase n=1 Tax=Marinomonas aquimarina TaxID=295068 RepID=A0A1A8SZ40_9GAMM|nr:tRNA-uridine aminocarboxypropyltransferase [Marinomonas aquimarina]SBS24706.1 DTW domain protein [Marinomonas aquimarina]
MHIWLLTHSEELKKANGTGQLISSQLAQLCSVIIWQRTEPATDLLNLPVDKTLVIYPSIEDTGTESVSPTLDVESAEHFIILDGTWQQARKMYNRSPYLHPFQTYEIRGQSSQYLRRRNQQKSGLCTAESAIYLLRQQGLKREAQQLEEAFLAFNQQH